MGQAVNAVKAREPVDAGKTIKVSLEIPEWMAEVVVELGENWDLTVYHRPVGFGPAVRKVMGVEK